MNEDKNSLAASISFEQCGSLRSSERTLPSIVQLSVLICIHMVALRSPTIHPRRVSRKVVRGSLKALVLALML